MGTASAPKTAAWLADARRTKLELKKRASWWKVLWYSHPHPREVLATKEQNDAMKVFGDWREAITLSMLQQDSVATMLEEVATKQADREEAAASKATTLKWVS